MSFEGHVEGFGLSDFLQAIQLGAHTGLARVTSGERSTTILFRDGRVECASSGSTTPIGAVLVQKDIISRDDLETTLRAQRERHRHYLFASLVAELGLAPFRELEEEAATHLRSLFVDLLAWPDGIFVFQPHHVPHEVSVLERGLAVDELLLASVFTQETMQRYDRQLGYDEEAERDW